MSYILSGVVAFIFLCFFDIYTLKNDGVKKKIFGIIGLGLFIFSAIKVTIISERIDFPVALRIVSGIFWGAAIFLLVYSLFLELPFAKTYGKKKHSNDLVDTGTYALCRHPGVLWFGLMFLFFFFTTGAKLILPAGIIWTSVDVLHVYLQEKLFFPKMFPEYKEYMKTTPMLIPTKESMNRCMKTLI